MPAKVELFRSKYPFGFIFFFFKDTAPPEIYPLSQHDALPIFDLARRVVAARGVEPLARAEVLDGHRGGRALDEVGVVVDEALRLRLAGSGEVAGHAAEDQQIGRAHV